MDWYRVRPNRATRELDQRATKAELKAAIEDGWFALVPATRRLADAPDAIHPSKNGLENGRTYPVFMGRRGFFICRKGDRVLVEPMSPIDVKRAWGKEDPRGRPVGGLGGRLR